MRNAGMQIVVQWHSILLHTQSTTVPAMTHICFANIDVNEIRGVNEA